MIQRIQSVYLTISIVLTGLLFLLPFAEIAKDGAIYLFNFKGILLDGVLKVNGIAIPVLLVVIMALHGLAIFGYKNRPRQTRVIIFAILALLVLIGLFIYFTYLSFSGALISFKFGTAFPLVAIVVDYLAIRAIGKDEALIRSIDRIR
jgi:ABC-type Na+ efflux pump permease subunit